jgi:hypothetical protein
MQQEFVKTNCPVATVEKITTNVSHLNATRRPASGSPSTQVATLTPTANPKRTAPSSATGLMSPFALHLRRTRKHVKRMRSARSRTTAGTVLRLSSLLAPSGVWNNSVRSTELYLAGRM